MAGIDTGILQTEKEMTSMRKFLLCLFTMVAGCGEFVEPSNAIRSAESAGWSEVRVTEQHGMAPVFYGCGKDDSVAFGIVGKNPAGKRANATVCCGLIFKSCTVRF